VEEEEEDQDQERERDQQPQANQEDFDYDVQESLQSVESEQHDQYYGNIFNRDPSENEVDAGEFRYPIYPLNINMVTTSDQ